MRRLNEDREVYFGKLAELLNGFVADRFHEYQELLQEEVQKELKRLQEVTKKHMDGVQECRKLEEELLSHGLEAFVNEKSRQSSAPLRKRRDCA